MSVDVHLMSSLRPKGNLMLLPITQLSENVQCASIGRWFIPSPSCIGLVWFFSSPLQTFTVAFFVQMDM